MRQQSNPTTTSATLRLVEKSLDVVAGSKAAAIYARYSTDQQDPRSLGDQESLCRKHAARLGLHVVSRVYADAEKTSRTLHGRDDFWLMIEAAKASQFRTIIVECTDRLSREGESLFGMYRRLQHLGVEIESVTEGRITREMIAIRALTGELYMKDLSNKVRRTMTKRTEDGLIQFRPPYGYRFAGGTKTIEIVPEQARIIVRIFEEYVAGLSPRTIAARLNLEQIPSPSGKAWTHQTILGGLRRHLGNRRLGVLGNPLYVGRLQFGATKGSLDPDTGKRCARPATEEMTVREMPELRIVSDELWQAAHDVADGRAVAQGNGGGRGPVLARNTSPLKELVLCQVCGGRMILTGGGSAAARFRCSAAHNGAQCEHSKTYDVKRVQAAVVEHLKDRFSDPAAVEAYWQGYVETWNGEADEARKSLTKIDKRLADIEAALMRLATGLAEGSLPPEIVKAKAAPLLPERDSLRERREHAQAEIKVVSLHPKAFAGCREFIGKLPDDLDELDLEGRLAFRNLVGAVVVHRTEARAPYLIETKFRPEVLTGLNLTPEARTTFSQMLKEQGVSSDCIPADKGPLYCRTAISISLGAWRERRAA